MSMKNPLTPAGIEPPTFRFVARHLNHCATAVPLRRVLPHTNVTEVLLQYDNARSHTNARARARV